MSSSPNARGENSGETERDAILCGVAEKRDLEVMDSKEVKASWPAKHRVSVGDSGQLLFFPFLRFVALSQMRPSSQSGKGKTSC